MQERDWYGRFICKSDDYRKVRAIRVTDKVWEEFGGIAVEQGYISVDLNKVVLGVEESS